MCRPRGYEFMVAGTFHVPSAIRKPLVFEATAHGWADEMLTCVQTH
jgi:hypothetical protein